MQTLTKQLAKRGLGIAAGMQLIALGRQMDKARQMENIEPQEPLEQNVDAPYEFVFYEKGVRSMYDTLSSIYEAVVRNGIDIELNVDSEAKKLIGILGRVLDIKKEDDGTEA